MVRTIYPDSDGRPIADNTLQFQWIMTIQGGVDALFRDEDVGIVAGDLLWYPVEGRPDIRTAPDALVALERPKGYRGSYQQWHEANIPPQVVVEVLSPGNRFGEMLNKFRFYERYGVEEYYLYDPYQVALDGWLRSPGGGELAPIEQTNGWTSPRLGIRFVIAADLEIYRPDGRKFATYVELAQQAEQAEQQALQAQQQAAQLRALGIDPDQV